MKPAIIAVIVVVCAVAAGAGGYVVMTSPTGSTSGQQENQTGNQPSGATPIIRLYYTYPTDPDKGKDYLDQNFGSAHSSDGVNFTNESGARLSDAYLSDPDVIKESSNTWTMFYSKAVAPEGNSEKYILLKATCSTANGTFITDNSFSGSYGNISSTIKIDNTWYVYGTSSGIKVSSYDPATNQLNYIKVAVAGEVYDPAVIQISENKFKMYYKQSGNTYCADSADGLTWENNVNVVNSAEVPGAIYVGGKIYLYYTNSAQDANAGKVLVKISSDEGTTFGTAQVVTGLAEAACDAAPVVYE
jgi:hypothetical protein